MFLMLSTDEGVLQEMLIYPGIGSVRISLVQIEEGFQHAMNHPMVYQKEDNFFMLCATQNHTNDVLAQVCKTMHYDDMIYLLNIDMLCML